jgi:hypothetical protein
LHTCAKQRNIVPLLKQHLVRFLQKTTVRNKYIPLIYKELSIAITVACQRLKALLLGSGKAIFRKTLQEWIE